jgi:hypothetical protein
MNKWPNKAPEKDCPKCYGTGVIWGIGSDGIIGPGGRSFPVAQPCECTIQQTEKTASEIAKGLKDSLTDEQKAEIKEVTDVFEAGHKARNADPGRKY